MTNSYNPYGASTPGDYKSTAAGMPMPAGMGAPAPIGMAPQKLAYPAQIEAQVRRANVVIVVASLVALLSNFVSISFYWERGYGLNGFSVRNGLDSLEFFHRYYGVLGYALFFIPFLVAISTLLIAVATKSRNPKLYVIPLILYFLQQAHGLYQYVSDRDAWQGSVIIQLILYIASVILTITFVILLLMQRVKAQNVGFVVFVLILIVHLILRVMQYVASGYRYVGITDWVFLISFTLSMAYAVRIAAIVGSYRLAGSSAAVGGQAYQPIPVGVAQVMMPFPGQSGQYAQATQQTPLQYASRAQPVPQQTVMPLAQPPAASAPAVPTRMPTMPPPQPAAPPQQLQTRVPAPSGGKHAVNMADIALQITRLKEQLDQGTITEEEFTSAKKRLLGI
ncbi:SHOCT domain-containing protein [Arcanobacterium haemolyticum]|nr:SHOCT domain-containing protein [Arcanobacterium haemolyticum]